MGVPKLLVVGFYCHLVEVGLIDSLSSFAFNRLNWTCYLSVAQIAVLKERGWGFASQAHLEVKVSWRKEKHMVAINSARTLLTEKVA